MYSYYLFSALGEKYQKFLWWKKYLTALQMVCTLRLIFFFFVFNFDAMQRDVLPISLHVLISIIIIASDSKDLLSWFIYSFVFAPFSTISCKQVQFVLIMVHAFQLLFIDCNYPRAFVWWIGMCKILICFSCRIKSPFLNVWKYLNIRIRKWIPRNLQKKRTNVETMTMMMMIYQFIDSRN